MKQLSFFFRILIYLTLGISIASDNISAQLEEYQSPPLFQSDELLSLTLTMNMRRVLNDVRDNPDQHPAVVSYIGLQGDTVKIPLRVRTRGHFRKDPTNCDFPPLRLNFSRETTANTLFEGQDKLKLVTHCRSRGERFEQNVLKEYLAYRIYNLLTEESYRVRLVEVTYADARGKKDTLQKMGFFTEPTEQMALRNRCRYIKIKNVQQEQCDRLKTSRLSVFQYMIGNTDWSVPAPHNIDLIQEQPGIPPVPVPYDFDWCGLVDSPYAVPSEKLDLRNVRERLFRGICRTEQELDPVFNEFRNLEEKVYGLIGSLPRFQDDEKERTLEYIREFYRILESPPAVRREFINNCRND